MLSHRHGRFGVFREIQPFRRSAPRQVGDVRVARRARDHDGLCSYLPRPRARRAGAFRHRRENRPACAVCPHVDSGFRTAGMSGYRPGVRLTPHWSAAGTAALAETRPRGRVDFTSHRAGTRQRHRWAPPCSRVPAGRRALCCPTAPEPWKRRTAPCPHLASPRPACLPHPRPAVATAAP